MRLFFTFLLLFSLPSLAQSPSIEEAPSDVEESSSAEDLSSAEDMATEMAPAQEGRPTPEDLMRKLDVEHIIKNGGPLVYLLAVLSILAFALVLYFVVTLNTSRVTPAAFVREIQLLLKAGDMAEAKELARKQSSPVAELVNTAFDYLDRAGDHADPELLRQVVEGEGVRQVGRLQSQVTYLMDIGVIAPMIGLLGTVMGMLRSFSSVALDNTQVKPDVLAGGVSQALVTTAAGLCVAIPAMIAYSIFRGRLAKLTANMELVAADVVTSLVHQEKK